MSFTGSNNYSIGGLVGSNRNFSTITNSYATGTVTGAGDYVGGLVGNNNSSTINNSYATVSFTGSNNYSIGGLVGRNENSSTITNSYASGSVTGSGDYIGGLVGQNNSSTINNSFYDNEANTANMVDSGYGRTKAQIVTAFSEKAGWTTKDASVEGYEVAVLPYLTGITRDADKSTTTLFQGGMGVDGNAYTITNWTQLQNINNSNILTQNYYFSLLNNLETTTAGYTTQVKENENTLANSGAGWNPIGNNTTKFTGNFDGLGHTIDKLFINRNAEYVGFFGVTDGATIKNLGLVNVVITGNGGAGGTTDPYGVNGGSSTVGGLIASAISSTISNSYTTGTVTGNGGTGGESFSSYGGGNGGASTVGGLIASATSSTISNSYTTGTVTGNGGAGGLSISSNTTSTTGTSTVGGLIGNLTGTVTNSFYDKTKTPTSVTIADVTGKTTKELSYGQMFKDASWDIVADSSVTSSTPVLKYNSTTSSYYWAIAPLSLSYTLTTNLSKTYDGETKTLSSLYTDVFGSDYDFVTDYKFQRNGSDVTGYRNAGTYDGIKVLSDSDFLTIASLGNTDGKYTITAKAITVNATAQDKTYDATNTVTATLASNGIISGDTVTLGGTATFANKNVGVDKTVTVESLTKTGTDAANYTISNSTATALADITAKAITVNATAEDKTYDATNTATATLASNGIISGDTVNFGGNATFANKNAGVDKTVTVASLSKSGVDAANYTISNATATALADITAKAITVNATAEDKTYDATNTAIATLNSNGIISGDAVTLGGTATFTDKNVGSDKNVNITSLTIDGDDASNYNLLTTTATTTADITRLSSVTWIGGATGNWFDPANWEGGAVPDLSNVANVVIPTGVAVSFDTNGIVSPADASSAVNIDNLGSLGSLIIVDGALSVRNSMTLDTFTQNGGTLTSGTLTTQRFTQTNGDITTTGNFAVNSNYSQGTTGSISVGGNTEITDATGGVLLGNLNTSGTTSITSTNGDITQANGTTISTTGVTTLASTSGNIALDSATNDFKSTVNASGKDVALADANGIELGSISATGTLGVNSVNDITQKARTTISTTGATTLASTSGNIALDSASNDFKSTVNASGKDVALADANGIELGSISATGTLTLKEGTLSPEPETPIVTPTPEPETEPEVKPNVEEETKKAIEDVITTIANTTAIKTPKVNTVVPQTVKTTTPVDTTDGTKINLVSQPLENQATRMVTMSELKETKTEENDDGNVNQDFMVPLGDDSIIQLVNAGVNLPAGVEQLFFVSTNENQEN